MTHTLLVTAISSLLLGFLFWSAVYLLGSRSRSKSTLLFIATLTFLCFPVVVFSIHERSSVDAVLESSVGAHSINNGPELMVSEAQSRVEGPIESGALAEASSYQDEAGESLVAPTMVIHEPVVEEPVDAGVNTPFESGSPELGFQRAPDIVIPGGVQKILFYVWIVWGMGAVVHGVFFLLQHICLRRESRRHNSVDDKRVVQLARHIADDLGVRNLPDLVCSDETSPYCYGFIRRRLHLPSSLLRNSPQTEISMILRHELQHIRQHDMALLVLQLPVRIIYWWNPLVTRLMKHLDYVRETLCDRAASRHCPDRYAHLLLHFASNTQPSCKTVVAMASSAKVMKARIKSLYEPSKTDLKIMGLACATIITGVVAFLLVNVQVAGAHPSSGVNGMEKGEKSAIKVSDASKVINRILHADASERTRIASEQILENNPVTRHYDRYLQAKESLGALLLGGCGKNHPDVIAQKRSMDEHLQLADRSVFELLLMLQPHLGSSISSQLNGTSGRAGMDELADPITFYPSYLKKLKSLPADKRLDYAAVLPISNNPALIHNIERQMLESSLNDAFAGGLGVKHPYVVGLQQRLKIYDEEYAHVALKITIGILKNEGGRPPGRIIFKLFSQRREISRLRAEGLGLRHPEVEILEQGIVVLEQRIDQWNQKEEKRELIPPAR